MRELDHLGRALGLEEMPQADQRAEVALLAVRSGLVGADEAPTTAADDSRAQTRAMRTATPGPTFAGVGEPRHELVEPQLLEPAPDGFELGGAELDEPAALLAQLERLAQAGLAGVEPR